MTFGTGVLQIGSTGAGVTELQQWLIDRRFLIAASTPTGTFDALTDQAVKAFQLSAGIACDGQVGDGTRRAAEGYAGNAATGGWHPTAVRNVQQTSIGGSYTTTTRRGVLHTTEGHDLPSYPNPPHFTVGRNGAGQQVQLWQHYPITVAARALANPAGPPETNRHGAIQIEIIGFAANTPSLATADADTFRMLGEWMRWAEANAAVAATAGHRFDGEAAQRDSVRLSVADWEASTGWLGHQHVPQNDHWDPGQIDIAALLRVPAAGTAAPPPTSTLPTLPFAWPMAAIGVIPVVRATTRALSNAFPSLTLAVDPAGLPYFEVLLTTSAALFHPQHAGQRTPQNFYASRADGLMRTDDAHGNYIAPVGVISGFAQANPDGGQIFYTIVGYADAAGSAPVPAAAPEVLARSAASVLMMPGFRGHTRTETLGVPLSMLKPAVRAAALGRPTRATAGRGSVGLLSYGPPSPAGAAFPTLEDPHAADRLDGEDGYDVRARQTVLLPLTPPPTAPSNGAHSGNGARPVNPVPLPPFSSTPPPPPPPSSRLPIPPPPVSAAATRMPRPAPAYAASYDDGWGVWEDTSNGHPPARQPGRPQPRNLSGEPSDVPVSDEYDDLGWRGSAYGEPDVAPLPASVTATRAEPPTLTDEQKRAVIETYVGPDTDLYAATSADAEYAGGAGTDHPAYQRYHLGLGYGIVAFSQDKGDLGQLLTLMKDRDATRFAEVFGPDHAELLTVTNQPGPLSRDVADGRSTRVQPVAGSDLWTEPWLSRFQAAGGHLAYRGAQIQLAAGLFLDPVTRFAADLGLATPRGLAIIFDRAAHRDVVNGMTWVVEAVGPLQTASLRDQALRAVGADSVEAFQRSQPDLLVDDQFGPLTHAALTGMLRGLVAAGGVSPVPLPSYRQLIDGLGARATGQPWGDRIVRLVGDPSIPDNFEAVIPAP